MVVLGNKSDLEKKVTLKKIKLPIKTQLSIMAFFGFHQTTSKGGHAYVMDAPFLSMAALGDFLARLLLIVVMI